MDALNLDVARGEVLGLLGVNGAGKSTTLRMIAGVLAPDAGEVLLEGEDLYEAPQLARRGIGYLPERAQKVRYSATSSSACSGARSGR